MTITRGSSGDAQQVQEAVTRLVGRYPGMFRKLAHWLSEPRLHGRFELERHGGERVTFEVSRRQQDGGVPDEARVQSPVKLL